MELFVKLSGKTELQQCLDRAIEIESCGCEVEELPTEASKEGKPLVFGKPTQPSVFQVDLMNAWVQP